MPREDRTGPNGNGPKTGRGMGPCEKSKKPAKSVDKPEAKKGLGPCGDGTPNGGQGRGKGGGQGGCRGRRKDSNGITYYT